MLKKGHMIPLPQTNQQMIHQIIHLGRKEKKKNAQAKVVHIENIIILIVLVTSCPKTVTLSLIGTCKKVIMYFSPSSDNSVASATSDRQPSVTLDSHQREHEPDQDGAECNPVAVPIAFEPERALTRSLGSDVAMIIVHPTCMVHRQQTDLPFFFSVFFSPFPSRFSFSAVIFLRQRGVGL